MSNFNSRPHGGRPTRRRSFPMPIVISTHALTEGDQLPPCFLPKQDAFQLTPSRRATCFTLHFSSSTVSFQLTPSRRATCPNASTCANSEVSFQLTPSRRATVTLPAVTPAAFISTHALTEGDFSCGALMLVSTYFNSRPHGGRLPLACFREVRSNFNSRPHGGRPLVPRSMFRIQNFNSRPHGGRRLTSFRCSASSIFQLTPSRRATPGSRLSS